MGNLASSVVNEAALSSSAVPSSQVRQQFLFEHAARQHVQGSVDSLVRDVFFHLTSVGTLEGGGNLLW